MASAYIAIAKASFTAACLRPDPSSVSRDEVTRFHALLESAVTQCTPTNVQKCKSWLCENVLPSSGRTSAFAKYLAALSTSYGKLPIAAAGKAANLNANSSVNGNQASAQQPGQEKPSSRRKRLHVLYVLNDVLHHTKYHGRSRLPGLGVTYADISSIVQPHLATLFTAAAGFDKSRYPRHHEKIEELLDTWGNHGFCSHDEIAKLRDTIARAATGASAESSSALNDRSAAFAAQQPQQRQEHQRVDGANSPAPAAASATPATINSSVAVGDVRELPYLLPATHGDPLTPYYDLPAANLLPHITPNRASPINPSLVRPLQFREGPAPDALAAAVRDILAAADDIYGGGACGGSAVGLVIDESTGRIVGKPGGHANEPEVDVDELGQRLVKDKETGAWVPIEGYYGWSVEFCRKMRQRKRDAREAAEEGERDRDREQMRPGMSGIGGRGDDWSMGGSIGLGMGRGLGMGAGGGSMAYGRGMSAATVDAMDTDRWGYGR